MWQWQVDVQVGGDCIGQCVVKQDCDEDVVGDGQFVGQGLVGYGVVFWVEIGFCIVVILFGWYGDVVFVGGEVVVDLEGL